MTTVTKALDLCSSPVLPSHTLGKFFHSTLLQFTQLYKRVPGYLMLDCVDICMCGHVHCMWGHVHLHVGSCSLNRGRYT